MTQAALDKIGAVTGTPVTFRLDITAPSPPPAQTETVANARLLPAQSLPSSGGMSQCYPPTTTSLQWNGSQIALSSAPDHPAPFAVADVAEITVSRPNGSTGGPVQFVSNTQPVGPADVGSLFGTRQDGTYKVTARVLDAQGPLCGGGNVYLVWSGGLTPPDQHLWHLLNIDVPVSTPSAQMRFKFVVSSSLHWLRGLLWKHSDATIKLVAPDGTIYDKTSLGSNYTDTAAHGMAIVNNPQPGTWELFVNVIQANPDTVFSVGVEGKQGDLPGIDTLAPLASIQLTGTKGKYWYRSSVVVSVSAEDNPGGSGVDHIEWSLDRGATWQTYNGTFTIDQEGPHGVWARAIDRQGNVEFTPPEEEVDIDKTPPVTAASATCPIDTNQICRDAVTVKLAVSDNLSGKDYVEYSRDGGKTWTQLPGDQDSFVIDGNGVFSFLYRAVDMAGNQEQTKDSGPIVINKYVIFSNRPNTPSFRLRGATGLNITGDIFSNGSFDFSGVTNSMLSGSLSAVGGSFTQSSNTGLQFPTPRLGASPVPMLTYAPELYQKLATVVFPRTLYIDDVNLSLNGVYFVNGDIYMSAVKLGGSTTLVATGSLYDTTTDSTFSTADPNNGMLLYVLGNMQLNSTGNRALGLLYAPYGTITLRSTGLTHRGSLVADQVVLDGATNYNLKYDAAFASKTVPLPLVSQLFTPPPSTLPPSPGVPSMVVPTTGATVTPRQGQVGVSWSTAPNAVGYQIQIASDSGFGSLIVDVCRLGTFHSAPLATGSYFARVRAINGAGMSGWSQAVAFSVAQGTTATPTATTGPTVTPTTAVPTATPTPSTTTTRTPTATPSAATAQVTVSPTTMTLSQPFTPSGMLTVTVKTPTGAATTTYVISVTGLPPGASATSGTLSIPGGWTSSTLISINAGTATKGTYQIQVVVAGGGASQNVPITLIIQ